MQRAGKAADPGIVHQDVQAAEFLLDALRDRLDRTEVGQITDRYFGLAARSGYGFRVGLQVLPGAAAKHGHDAQLGKPDGYRSSDPAPCTCNHGDLSEESSIFVPFLVVLCSGQFSLLMSLCLPPGTEPGRGGLNAKSESGIECYR
jgi:hypothetical protein